MAVRPLHLGTPIPALRLLARDERFELAGLVTQPNKSAGRGFRLSLPPVKAVALEHGIQLLQALLPGLLPLTRDSALPEGKRLLVHRARTLLSGTMLSPVPVPGRWRGPVPRLPWLPGRACCASTRFSWSWRTGDRWASRALGGRREFIDARLG